MAKFLIEGGRLLSGTVRPSGNKNEALPIICASLLTEKPVTLNNVPKINDVLTLCKVIEKLGAKVVWNNEDSVTIDASKLNSFEPDPELCNKIRASILLLGPLLARMGKIKLPLPGGDVIGARRIDTHFEGAISLGAKIKFGHAIEGHANKISGTDVYLDEPSVTGTENLVMMTVFCEGTTTLYNAASEPHVVGLCNFLNKMGADIEGIGTNRLKIRGVTSLGAVEHVISADFMEIGSFLCLGAISGGAVTIENVDLEQFRFILKIFDKIGIEPTYVDNKFIIDRHTSLRIKNDVSGRIPTIYSGPWPTFPTDLMSVTIVAATQAQGTAIFFEKMFEGRMFFTDNLMAMGATIILCDPHRVVVNGPSQLYAAKMSSPDVRAGMALLMAALAAKGTSEIDNIYQIERGYYNICEKLEQLGAAIKRIE